MCGRFSLTTPAELIAEAFGLDAAPQREARYNVAPTQPVLAVRTPPEGSGREAVALRWGLISKASRAPPVGPPLINARAETVAERPAFKHALRARRCLVPADGFYEWQGAKGARRAFHFRLRDGAPFGFAGLWEPWAPPDTGVVGSCTVLTTTPNDLVREVHDRMPVMLLPETFSAWLDPTVTEADDLAPLLAPLPADRMSVREVGRAVNDVRCDGPECLEPPRELRLF
jgi:putative SOS response-associated peptidase YedK